MEALQIFRDRRTRITTMSKKLLIFSSPESEEELKMSFGDKMMGRDDINEGKVQGQTSSKGSHHHLLM
jgi:hypothetical protein